MTWTRGSLAVLAVCVLLLTGSAGCGSGDARESGASPTRVGSLLEDRDAEGRPYREVARRDAPDVGVEVQPDAAGGWDVRLTVRNFRFSPPGAAARAVPGQGLARLYLDGRPVARLRVPECRLADRLVPRGTHQVTVRLYADDGTVWAVDGAPVESTADITASETGPDPEPEADPEPDPAPEPDPTPSADPRRQARTQGTQTRRQARMHMTETRRQARTHAADTRSRTTDTRSRVADTRSWIRGRGSPDRAGRAS
ncbi:hypothetical protein ACIP6X_27590 [Streptomyces coeruleorubidus]|uniref:hypothetical protein n=1 Tax=Streptomyces coeruleorubidus TaxID=116188 RepID=UPI0037FFBF04